MIVESTPSRQTEFYFAFGPLHGCTVPIPLNDAGYPPQEWPIMVIMSGPGGMVTQVQCWYKLNRDVSGVFKNTERLLYVWAGPPDIGPQDVGSDWDDAMARELEG